MEKKDKKFKRITRFCIPMRDDCIRKEVNEYLKGYNIVDIYKTKNKDTYSCELENEKNERINLQIGLDYLHILKKGDNYLDKVVINNDEKWYQRIIEKRAKGFVVTDITKDYGMSKRFNKETVLTDITEERHILSNESMEKVYGKENIENQTLVHICLTMFNANIKLVSDLTTKFSTHMNYYYNSVDGVGAVRDNLYPTKTYLNDKEISHTYDIVDGYDKIYRIYDLYNGIINKRNERDIKSIHLGLLAKRGFDLRTYEGISEQENALVGESLIPVSDEYRNYLKEFFKEFNHYDEEIKLDRESLLNAIYYVMPLEKKVDMFKRSTDLAKKEIEKVVGIPYEEYEKLDDDEQRKLIEEKTGKKVEPDHRLYIDGISMDDEHIIKMDEVDKFIDSFPKKVLRKIKNKFNK